MPTEGILSIDQGTTSSRAIVFGVDGKPICSSQQEFKQIYPQNGWVEHDPEEIWTTSLSVAKSAVAQATSLGVDVLGLGITNQRQTTIVWDKKTGVALYNAIVWQDRRTTEQCQNLQSHLSTVREKTGLLLDPYFSATKIQWILDNVEGARALAKQGRLAFGTVDSFLIYRLTNGKCHVTDATNASRTSL